MDSRKGKREGVTNFGDDSIRASPDPDTVKGKVCDLCGDEREEEEDGEEG